jgi:hypothetical protein
LSVYVLAPLADSANLTVLDLHDERTNPIRLDLPVDLISFIGFLPLHSLTFGNPLAPPGVAALGAMTHKALLALKLDCEYYGNTYSADLSCVPSLTSLSLSGTFSILAPFTLPVLEELHVEVKSLESNVLEALVKSSYPQLRRFSIEKSSGDASSLRAFVTLLVERAPQLPELKVELQQVYTEKACACYCLDCISDFRSVVLQFPKATFRLTFL